MKWRLLGILWGACLGAGLHQAGVGLLPEAPSSLWDLTTARVPVELGELAGALRPDPQALDLWGYRGASLRLVRSFHDGTITLGALVPDGGQLGVRLGAEAGREGQQLAPTRRPPGVGPGGPSAGPGGPGAGPGGPGAGPGGPSVEASPAGAAAGPRPGRPSIGTTPERGITILVDRSSRNAIVGRGIGCEPAVAPSERFELALQAQGDTIHVRVDGQEVTRCTGTWPVGSVALTSGIRRIQVQHFEIEGPGMQPFRERFGGFLRSGATRLLAAILVGLGVGMALPKTKNALPSRWRLLAGAPAAWGLVGLPFLALPLLGAANTGTWLETLRMLSVPPALGPLLFAGLPGSACIVGLLAGSPGKRSFLAATLLLPLLVLTAICVAWWGSRLSGPAHAPPDAWGWLLLSGVGPALATVVRLNTGPPRPLRNGLLSLAAVVVGVLLAEAGARATSLDHTWIRTAGWERASSEFEELLEIRKYRSYPDSGFPVRPPEVEPGRKRIVALGGSSTGGAYQMDDIDLFWPKKLDDLVRDRGFEVINQGVGGWNTLHVRLYVESQFDRLSPDILVLYVGHNDLFTRSPVPYRELWARYRAEKAGPSWARSVSETLDRSRLYVGLKFFVLALRQREQAVAVPVEDAAENLRAIADLATGNHARVLFMTEGVNPDPAPMEAYGAMLSRLADQSGNLYLDAATALYDAGNTDLFLDDCHLSIDGHLFLADLVERKLVAAGWIPPRNP